MEKPKNITQGEWMELKQSLFNEVYNKFVECVDDEEFTQYLNKNTTTK